MIVLRSDLLTGFKNKLFEIELKTTDNNLVFENNTIVIFFFFSDSGV